MTTEDKPPIRVKDVNHNITQTTFVWSGDNPNTVTLTVEFTVPSNDHTKYQLTVTANSAEYSLVSLTTDPMAPPDTVELPSGKIIATRTTVIGPINNGFYPYTVASVPIPQSGGLTVVLNTYDGAVRTARDSVNRTVPPPPPAPLSR